MTESARPERPTQLGSGAKLELDPTIGGRTAIELSVTADSNDLLSALVDEFALSELKDDFGHFTSVIVKPADVLVVFLWRGNEHEVKHRSDWKEKFANRPPPDSPFQYPLDFYMDQFMLETAHLGAQKRAERKELIAKLDRCLEKKQSLSFHKVMRNTTHTCFVVADETQ